MPPMIGTHHEITESGSFDGMVNGNLTVQEGVHVTLKGMINGDLIVERGSVVELSAMVGGRIVNQGGEIVTAA